jgi:demethylmenaquinone methyltransferase/2-methoxy-6-polyprenyl-1,4-benzoquinol methylase
MSLKQEAREIFSGLYASYDEILHRLTLYQDRRWKRRLLEAAKLSDGMLVLDAGCGTGVLEDHIGGTNVVVGIDMNEGMVRLAKAKRRSRFGALIVADAEHLPFRDSTFDAVLSCYLPKYCDSCKLLSELRRVITSGGRLAAYDFIRPSGWFAPLHTAYVYVFLRIMALGTRLARSELNATFERLPVIISETRWPGDWVRGLHENRFSQVALERLSSGVVLMVTAVRRR